eukprot:SAG22_NODE_200_length_15420_cov_4.424581_9_plen_242_part_00
MHIGSIRNKIYQPPPLKSRLETGEGSEPCEASKCATVPLPSALCSTVMRRFQSACAGRAKRLLTRIQEASFADGPSTPSGMSAIWLLIMIVAPPVSCGGPKSVALVLWSCSSVALQPSSSVWPPDGSAHWLAAPTSTRQFITGKSVPLSTGRATFVKRDETAQKPPPLPNNNTLSRESTPIDECRTLGTHQSPRPSTSVIPASALSNSHSIHMFKQSARHGSSRTPPPPITRFRQKTVLSM